MDESPPDPTPTEPSTPTRRPNVMPSRATRAGAGMSAVGGLGALVGFFLPWFIFLAVVQVGCRAASFQTEVYNLYGLAIALGSAGETASALAFVALLCAGAILTLAIMSARRPRLFRIRLLLLASLVGMGALGLLGAFAASGRVSLAAKNLYGSFLGFGPGFWVTTGSLALALVGGAVLHAAARPLRQRAPVGEIALALLGVVGLLFSTVAAVVRPTSTVAAVVRPTSTVAAVVHPTSNLPFTCGLQGNAGLSGGGVVYVTSADGVYALDAASGRVRWRCRNPLGGVVTEGAPALADGVLFVASRDGYVYAIRANDATILWRADVGGRGDMTQTPHVAPIVADGLVFGVNGDGQLYALRASDGGRAWSNDDMRSAALHPTMVWLVVVGGELIYSNAQSQLTAVNERTGRLMWMSGDSTLWSSTPSLGSDPVVVKSGVIYDKEYSTQTQVVYLVARSITTGVRRWRLPLSPPDGPPFSSVFTVVDGAVYLEQRQPGNLPSVSALRADTGTMFWFIPPPDSSLTLKYPSGQLQDTLVVKGDEVYVAVSSAPQPGPGFPMEAIYSFDAQQGTVRWRYNMAHLVTTPSGSGHPNLAVVGDAVYLLNSSGQIVAFDTPTGSLRWQFNSEALPATWAPMPGDMVVGDATASGSLSGLLFVATSHVYAINQTNGAMRWQFSPDKPVTPYVQPQSGDSPFVPLPVVSPPTFAP